MKDDKGILKKSNIKIVASLLFLTLLMFGFGFALVPLYNVFCKVTGFNGKTANVADLSPSQPTIYQRIIIIEFVTTLNANLAWKFYPLVKKITIHPGENKRVSFYAENDSPNAMTVQAIPSVAPGRAAKYLKKTECFCFTRQTLKSGEGLDMPVIFHLDPDLPQDIKIITLSYTLFDATHIAPLPENKRGRIR